MLGILRVLKKKNTFRYTFQIWFLSGAPMFPRFPAALSSVHAKHYSLFQAFSWLRCSAKNVERKNRGEARRKKAIGKFYKRCFRQLIHCFPSPRFNPIFRSLSVFRSAPQRTVLSNWAKWTNWKRLQTYLDLTIDFSPNYLRQSSDSFWRLIFEDFLDFQLCFTLTVSNVT